MQFTDFDKATDLVRQYNEIQSVFNLWDSLDVDHDLYFNIGLYGVNSNFNCHSGDALTLAIREALEAKRSVIISALASYDIIVSFPSTENTSDVPPAEDGSSS